jgi:hypothetical protein
MGAFRKMCPRNVTAQTPTMGEGPTRIIQRYQSLDWKSPEAGQLRIILMVHCTILMLHCIIVGGRDSISWRENIDAVALNLRTDFVSHVGAASSNRSQHRYDLIGHGHASSETGGSGISKIDAAQVV